MSKARRAASKFSPPIVDGTDDDGFPLSYEEVPPVKSVQPAPEETEEAEDQPERPAAVVSPQPKPQVQTVTTEPVTKISKTEAVKAAIDAGFDTASVGIPWIKEQFGIEIGSPTFNTSKQNLKNRDRTPAARKPQAAFYPPERPARTPPTSSTVSAAQLIREVKGLIERYGAEEVSEVLAALSE